MHCEERSVSTVYMRWEFGGLHAGSAFKLQPKSRPQGVFKCMPPMHSRLVKGAKAGRCWAMLPEGCLPASLQGRPSLACQEPWGCATPQLGLL